ncbi:glyoxal oxidase [Schizopora paradoxa]|uniref:Glyoxal oxidase n=1 Tax=Schizopora paradoxa TaxID=27342 RepID=A0A0H2RJA1_9AGAM|nr:glyoxal oxidase [Schizopora paradoxa]
MMLVGNEQKVYILDKAEGNAAQINGHPAWGAVYDIASQQTELMDVATNVFCASGMHLPNGSFVTFGGNQAVGVGGNSTGAFNSDYGDYDGRQAIRILDPCTGDVASQGAQCAWYDNATFIAMQKQRWYSAAEPLGDGSIAIIGGFVNGGYINRNFPNTDPEFEGGAAEPTYEFFPSKGPATTMQFMITTSGLNSYALAYTLASGNMFLQANFSTIIWNPLTNVETPLPNMPGNVIRVYPASGANAMMPLTPANNYTQTILFCGGSDMPDASWGDYSFPAINTWDYPASADCQQMTPEPADGSQPQYVQDDDLPGGGRTMGQFILLPDGTMLIVNGGLNGTAGYAQATGQTPTFGQMGFGESLASGPQLTPAIYDPRKPSGSRWSQAGLSTAQFPRLYHSSAILLPDASVLIAGSNPNVDVNTSTVFPTTYTAEKFYPPYFASTRPVPQGVPTNISYGGPYFNVTVPASSYSGNANDAASNTTVMLMRPGFTTHAMNMGQRALQLNNTYTVNSDGSYVLHVSQAPNNPNILTPGPVFVFVVVKGIPSNGTLAIVGNGQIGTQPTADMAALPDPVRLDNVSGSGTGSSGGSGSSSSSSSGSSSHTGVIVGGIVAALAVLGVAGAVVGICLQRRRRAAASSNSSSSKNAAAQARYAGAAGGAGMAGMGMRQAAGRGSEGDFVPLQHADAWNASTASLNGGGMTTPYKDAGSPTPGAGGRGDYDPYYEREQR